MQLYQTLRYGLFLWPALLCLTACEEEPKPTCLLPVVNVEEAREITRTSALLAGEVTLMGDGAVLEMEFRYGPSADMEHQVTCDPAQLHPSIRLEELQPNTTYYYCLKAGNGYSDVQSSTRNFTTQPNRKPTIDNLRILSQSPLSITLQYDLPDNGGEPITSAGFYYTPANGEEQCWPLTDLESSPLRARISGLAPQTSYTIQAYAGNSVGETRSEPISFHTSQAVILTAPGTLAATMGEEEKYRHSTLSIAGPLNGTDFQFIREMAGRDNNGAETPGRLSHLSLADATLCAGGNSYDGVHYLEENRIGYGLFADCLYLQQLSLPEGTIAIEENAFKNCQALESLQIPAGTSQVTPSPNCPSLTDIEVSEGNDAFCSQDGVLYDKECTRLLWFPEGKSVLQPFPSTLVRIGEYAFRNSRISQIELPSGIKEIGRGAFQNTQIETIILPEALELIANGLFQGCSRLTSVTLGSQTSYLSDYCFDGCPLEQLHVRATPFPPVCQEHTFTGMLTGTAQCTLYVPSQCKNIYRNATYWGLFGEIVEESNSSAER